MKTNNQLLVITHLSQLLDLVALVSGFLVPFMIWFTNKDTVIQMDEHGKAIINFRISMLIYAVLCIVGVIFWFGIIRFFSYRSFL